MLMHHVEIDLFSRDILQTTCILVKKQISKLVKVGSQFKYNFKLNHLVGPETDISGHYVYQFMVKLQEVN